MPVSGTNIATMASGKIQKNRGASAAIRDGLFGSRPGKRWPRRYPDHPVVRRLDTALGKFSLLEVQITGKNVNRRVHMASRSVTRSLATGFTVRPQSRRRAETGKSESIAPISLPRNLLHAARLELSHRKRVMSIALESSLPPELKRLLGKGRESRYRQSRYVRTGRL